MNRRRARTVLVVVACIGAGAGVLAAGLLWMVFTRPVAIAQFIERTF